MVYFERMMQDIRKNPMDGQHLLHQIVTPFMVYTFCDHYYGDEPHRIKYGTYDYATILTATDLMRKPHTILQPYDILYCEFRYLKQFVETFLPTIRTPFILVTGSYHIYNTYDAPLYAKQILEHPSLHRWFSQNPMIETDDSRYQAIAYGIDIEKITEYAKTLLKPPVPKTNKVEHLRVSKTHPCRKELPDVPPLPPSEFYDRIRKSTFLLSPIGDRNDCYRHWEAIGLGTIPICNMQYPKYKDIFGSSMMYVTIEDMKNLIGKQDLLYTPPNKDLLCVDYWKNKIFASRPPRREVAQASRFNGRIRIAKKFIKNE